MASAETLRLRQAVYERHGHWLVLVMLAVLVPLEVWNFIAALFGNHTGFRYLISLFIPLVIIRNITGMWLGNPAARKTTALFLGLRCFSYVVALVTLVPVFLKPVEEIENRPASDAWLRMMLLFLGPMLFFLLLHLGFALLVMYSPGVKAFVKARCRRGPFYVRWPKWLRSTLGCHTTIRIQSAAGHCDDRDCSRV